MNARVHLERERRALLALCRSLTPAEWEASSLCAGWRVRDVVAHIVGLDHDLANLLRARGDLDAANQLAVERRRDWPITTLLDELATLVPVRGFARLGAPLLLVDNWIHHEDIRRPLGRPRAQDPERVRWVLRVARLTPYSRARDVTLVATDLGLTLGRGPAVYGAAADLILAITGRESQLAQVHGPGVARLGAAQG